MGLPGYFKKFKKFKEFKKFKKFKRHHPQNCPEPPSWEGFSTMHCAIKPTAIKYVCPEPFKSLSPQGTRTSVLNSLSPLSHSLRGGWMWTVLEMVTFEFLECV